MQLCPGVNLPLEAGACSRLIWPESTRCTACHGLLTHALNPAEVALSARLDGADEADDGEHDAAQHDDFSRTVPLLNDLSALSVPCLR